MTNWRKKCGTSSSSSSVGAQELKEGFQRKVVDSTR
jgi:hypothetical protein